jgi:sugar phosphate isomerase/epimerase
MARIPIALQLYSVREDCKKDFPGTLAAVKKMGYEGVEFAGYYERSAAELKKMVGDLGLGVAGTHVGLDMVKGDELKRTIAFNQELGNKYLIVPWADYKTKAEWVALAHTLNEAAHVARAEGLSVGYHNHAQEFKTVEGVLPWDVLAYNTKPSVVLQLDFGHCLRAGADLLAALRTCVERAKTVHVKEWSATNDKPIVGEGDVPWAEMFQVMETTGTTEWYIVEQEVYPYPPMESSERAIKNLKKMGK